MRIAVIADIHGNIEALETVLSHIEKQSVDQIIVAGDTVIGSPHSALCWEKIQSLGCPVIRGNHERYLFDFASPNAPESWQAERYAPIRQAYQQFSKETIDAMRALPAHVGIEDMLVVHASYRNDTDTVVETSRADELESMFAGSSKPFIVRAHNHVWFDCAWNSRSLHSVGSVGLPLNGDVRAQYAVVEKLNKMWKTHEHYVDYDLGKAVQSFEDGAYFAIAGSVGKLFLQELKTARHQLTPFWNKYTAAVDIGELTLEQAVTHYLNE